ncbi:MAG: ABC transporter permease [Planctomycetes bacterium]|nr:ABC transporter permease [Planctomycetota bacterium]
MSTTATKTLDTPQRVQPRAFIRPRSGWSTLDVFELWRYRDLLFMLAKRDVMVRYKQATLGVAWAIIVPLTQMAVFVLFFGNLLGAGNKANEAAKSAVIYPVFLLAAQTPWNYFASTVVSACNSLVGDSNLIRKVYFPRLVVPLSSIGAPFVDFVIAFIVLLGLMLWYGMSIVPALVALPLLAIAVTLAALGVGLLLSALTVSYRDFRAVIPVLIQLWFYATPVIISLTWLGEKWNWLLMLLKLNPMAGPIEAFRAVVLGLPIDWTGLWCSLGSTLLFIIIGLAYFCRVERRFADVV